MSNVGSRVDWGENGRAVRLGRKMQGGSFSSLLGSKKSGKNNNKYTGYTSKGGGSASERKAAGIDNLHVTQVERPLNLAKGEAVMGGRKDDGGMHTSTNQWVKKGGGTASKAIVQGKVAGVKVQPEC